MRPFGVSLFGLVLLLLLLIAYCSSNRVSNARTYQETNRGLIGRIRNPSYSPPPAVLTNQPRSVPPFTTTPITEGPADLGRSNRNNADNIKQLFLQYIAEKAAQHQPKLIASRTRGVREQLVPPSAQHPFRTTTRNEFLDLAPQPSFDSSPRIPDDQFHVESLVPRRIDSRVSVVPKVDSPPSPTPLPHLNLSSSSQQIAQLFKELNRHSRKYPVPPNSSCGNHVITIGTNYEISSPNYPDKYPSGSDCTWNVQAKRDQTLRIQIFKLSIEHDKFCRFDYLDIQGVQQIDKKTGKMVQRTKRFCGNYLKGEEFEIGSNHTTIVFHSDGSNELSGFHLRVIAESHDCLGKLYVHNTTYLTSPRYPEAYDDSKSCWTQVTTRPDHRLLVDFEDLRLEPDINCEFDFIEVFNAPTAEPEKSLGRFCDSPENSSLLLHSTGNSLVFHFESDNFLALRGYKAKLIALRQDVDLNSYTNCNWSADWQNMTITSPFYPKPYPSGTECQTSISAASPDERIIILFDWIDLVDDYTPGPSYRTDSSSANTYRLNCSLDRLEIYESVDDREPSNVFCGFRSQPFKYVSQSNSIRLVFRSLNVSIGASADQQRVRTTMSAIDGINNPGFRARFTFVTDTQSNAHQEDAGTQPDSSIGHKEQATQTDVDKPLVTSPRLIRRPENGTVRAGSSHILYCEVESTSRDEFGRGQAQPQVIWFKGDREIHEGVSSDGSSLLIRQFHPTDSIGRYICVYGDNSSDAWLRLRLDSPTCSSGNVLFRERPKDQFTSEGEFVMLHCSAALAKSNEDVEITWERLPLRHQNGESSTPQPVVYNSRIKKLSRGDLLFDRVLAEDSGYYFCVVKLNPDLNIPSEECVLKSVARVEVNQRVDVSQICGRNPLSTNREEGATDVGKIIGGTEAVPGEFPWMVMFWDEKRHVFCGGALLNERWVVTAAHCFTDITDESTVFVKLGKYDQTQPESSEVVTKIQHIIKHPHFSNETFDNDIALVKVMTHITFTDYILPICMPNTADQMRIMNSYYFSPDDPEASETKFGFVTGWGRLKENGPLPRYLHKIRLPIVDRAKCHQSTSFKVTDNMFCAGYGKEIVGDACKGDSGGPFAVNFQSHWTLLGIVSWGEGCGRPEKYGYYTRVNNYDNWIRRLTRLN